VLASSRQGQSGYRVAARFGREHVGEVAVERAALQAAGLVDREQPFDRAFAALGAAAEGELAVDDGGAQAALGGVVGRLHIGHTFQVTSSPSRPNVSCAPRPRSAWKVKSRRRCDQQTCRCSGWRLS
jgi:hypothetical protein